MRRSTPQPDDFDARQKARQTGLSRPKPPRVLISGDELEDASEWEVVVVENEAIDDQRALEIARQRHRQSLSNLPSLDERDINHALGIGAEGDAEDPDGIDSDAFVLPGDTPPARRIVGPAPLPVGLIFDGVEEPDDERPSRFDLPEDSGSLDDLPEASGSLDEAMAAADEGDPGPGLDEVVFAEQELGEPTAATPAQLEPEAPPSDLPVTSWSPAALESRFPVDDVDHDFYGIGDEAIDAPVVAIEEPVAQVAEATTTDAEGLDREHEDVPEDDPHHSFYALDDQDSAAALETPGPAPTADGEPAAPAEPVKLWGTGRPKSVDGKIYAPGEVPPEEVAATEEDDDFYSSFPIDPDEFLTEEGAEVDVNELDYASVFGPVDAPRRSHRWRSPRWFPTSTRWRWRPTPRSPSHRLAAVAAKQLRSAPPRPASSPEPSRRAPRRSTSSRTCGARTARRRSRIYGPSRPTMPIGAGVTSSSTTPRRPFRPKVTTRTRTSMRGRATPTRSMTTTSTRAPPRSSSTSVPATSARTPSPGAVGASSWRSAQRPSSSSP